MSELYRVGRHQPQNVYRGEQYIGVMFAPEDAALTVAALNGIQPVKAVTDLLKCATELTGDKWGCPFGDAENSSCDRCGIDHLAELKRAFGDVREPVALLDASGGRWDRVGLDEFQLIPGRGRSRDYIEGRYGPVTEVRS